MLESAPLKSMLLAAVVVALAASAQAGLPGAPVPPPQAPDVQAVLDPALDRVGTLEATVDEAAEDATDDADPQPAPLETQPITERVESNVERALDPVADHLPADPLAFTLDTAGETARAVARDVRRTLEPLTTPAQPQDTPAAAPASIASATVLDLQPIVAGGLLIAAAAGAGLVALWLGSSSTVAGGAAAASAAKSTELRRLLPLASPLFTRFEKDTVLGHPRREALYALILQQPGISLQALGDASGLSRTAVLHHLRLMELQHLVVSKRMGRSRHYYENGGRYGRDQKEAYAVLQNDRTRQVSDFIRAHPGTMQKALCQAMGIQPSIAHWHVRRLQEARLVEAVRKGRTVAYFPAQGLAAPLLPVDAAPVPAGPLANVLPA